MFYRILILFMVSFSAIFANSFEKINPAPTTKMVQNQAKAKICPNPLPADEKLSEEFKYGCFCGKNYPDIKDENEEDFRKLTKAQRVKLIEQYYLIKPYDAIDAICQQHDICYLYQGKRAKVCNDAIYHDLEALATKFRVNGTIKKEEQCSYLASDIASVFTTIFASAEDEDNIFEIGALFFNTGITLAHKTFEESLDTVMKKQKRYPPKEERCLFPKDKK